MFNPQISAETVLYNCLQIIFKQQAFNETVKKCYRPIEKVCNGQGPEQCRTVYESACTTKYIEKQPGKFVGDTHCEKLPINICGSGCVTEEGDEATISRISVLAEKLYGQNFYPQTLDKVASKNIRYKFTSALRTIIFHEKHINGHT
jgi:hypothetical protein